MADTLIVNQSTAVSGLGTSTFTAPTANSFIVSVSTTLVPPSGVQIVINKNGTPVLTVPLSAPSAITTGATAQIACAIADVITIVLSSSVVTDSILNNVKSSMLVTQLSF